ncbi:MAG TPA: PRTRC system ThiF family protein [Puia sp.]|jgi:PRTRC genetic system ThiF family protein|nr:PRTRC system ThiF family protein [Puia sp.]
MIHYTQKYLLDPAHKVTVHLVGLGGTGSQMLNQLVRLHETLKALGHPGLHIRAWDADVVSAANLARQLFYEPDLGLNKALVLVSRINRCFGLDWEANSRAFDGSEGANIIITCIDTAAGRIKIGAQLKPRGKGVATERTYYWLDMGNAQETGQAILGTIQPAPQPTGEKRTTGSLKTVLQKFPQLSKLKEVDEGPSCSLAQAINRQDLFINSTLAQFGAGLLWKLFRKGVIRHHGCYVNLENMTVNPIPIK